MQAATDLEHCVSDWSTADLTHVAVAATGKEEIVRAIKRHVERLFPEASWTEARSEAQFGSLINSYDDPATMGVDRWLAMVAARGHSPANCLIIDAGSAVTVDCLNKDGHHQGGWILPGITMMHKALLTGTARVRDTAHHSIGAFGKSTGAAVSLGTQNAVTAACARAVEVASRIMPVDHILLTGGDREFIAESLEDPRIPPVIMKPELVLDGLALRIGGKA